jgi:hypothetical protein
MKKTVKVVVSTIYDRDGLLFFSGTLAFWIICKGEISFVSENLAI